jgi:hypothetical protein
MFSFSSVLQLSLKVMFANNADEQRKMRMIPEVTYNSYHRNITKELRNINATGQDV